MNSNQAKLLLIISIFIISWLIAFNVLIVWLYLNSLIFTKNFGSGIHSKYVMKTMKEEVSMMLTMI